MSIYQNTSVVLDGHVTVEGTVNASGHGSLTWDLGLQRVDVSAFDAKHMQQIADAAAEVAAGMRHHAKEVAA